MEILNQLTPEQEQFALQIAQQARAMGIDPRLAVALAYQESKLNPSASGGKGEIGIMQVMPSTGKGLGFSVEDLKDPSKNIQAGLTYLKQGLDRYKDPVLAAAAYNAGLDHPYFSDPDKSPLPDSTKSYLKNISSFGGFSAAPQQDQASSSGPGGEEPAGEDVDMEAKKRIAANVLGTLGGAAAGAGIDVSRRILPAVGRAMQGAMAGAPSVPSPSLPGAIQATGMPSAAPGAGVPRPVAGGPAGPVGGPVGASPISPQGGSGTFNYGKAFGLTDIEAGRALDMSKQPGGASDLIRQRAEGLQRVQQMGGGFAENPRYGGLMTPERGAGGGPRASFTQTPAGLSQLPPTQPIPTTPRQPSALSQMAGATKRGLEAVARSPVGGAASGALAGLSLASQGQELADRYQQQDVPGMAISGLGTVGGLMQFVPGPSRAVGMGLSAASPLVMAIYDKLRSEPDPLAATEEELKAAARPAFIYARPGLRPALR